ncbi:MAG: DUF1801 domain-containing protein [Chloroflexi bacterium]|nr:DUF1801 domain-containing protein [Chloroflexota bacterium]
MEGSRIKASTIDGYIALYPSTVQDIMQELRRIVHDVAPDVTEAISYAIPAFKRAGGNLRPSPAMTVTSASILSPPATLISSR